jgi:hypothetical protein
MPESLNDVSIEELEEQADEIDYLTPREFAKLIKVRPQQVYGWMRKGVLHGERCACGRVVLCVSKSKTALATSPRTRREALDTDPDDPRVQGQRDDMFDLPQED